MLALVFATTWDWGRHVNTYLDLCVCTGFVDVLELYFGSGLKQFTWVLGSTSPIMASFLKS
jgi:hypothetical protein